MSKQPRKKHLARSKVLFKQKTPLNTGPRRVIDHQTQEEKRVAAFIRSIAQAR
jgi:hypothetical protein